MFYKKAVLKNLAIFIGKHLSWSLSFNENAGLQSFGFIKKRLQYRCFVVNIAKFLRTLVLENICKRLFERFPTLINNITRTYEVKKTFSLKQQQQENKQKSDLNIDNFAVLLHFLITYIFSKI